MSKQIEKAVMERSGGACELCGSRFMAQRHHIIKGNGKRRQHETIESVIVLCWEHHHGTNGIHGKNGRRLDIKLKKQLQETYYSQGHSEEEVRGMMGGKLYSEE